MTEQLPKHELLLKLGRMSESANDNEALVAIRKFNTVLRENGWDWEKLLTGKIKIIADPWANIPKPPPPPPPPVDDNPSYYQPRRSAPRSQAKPYQPRPQPRPAPSPPPPPPRPTIQSAWVNQFAGHCYCCGIYVDKQKGFLFKPSGRPEVVCTTCNSSAAPIPTKAATKQKLSAQDVLNMI